MILGRNAAGPLSSLGQAVPIAFNQDGSAAEQMAHSHGCESRNSDWLPVVEVPNVRNLDVPGPNGLRVAVNPAQVRVAASSCAG